jgi:hypothetical protein
MIDFEGRGNALFLLDLMGLDGYNLQTLVHVK